jgi:predicted amidohydrolase
MQQSDQTLRLAVIQSSLYWENPDANYDLFSGTLKNLERPVDLVILPETFSTGFTMNVKDNADTGRGLEWMKEMAAIHGTAIAGSLIVKDSNKFYNRLYFVDRSGSVEWYDKRHLFTMGREDKDFTPGKERVIVKLGKFRILLQICYDLRFPVFVRNRGEYDVLLYVANWPSAREAVWSKLLPARAIENQCYVIGANRCGVDGEGEGTCGNSIVLDPRGKRIARLNDQPGILFATLDYPSLVEFRDKFPVLKDADEFDIRF